jgi:O-antigen ligase
VPSRLRSLVVAVLVPAAVLVVDPRGLAPFGPAKWAVITTLLALAAACAWRPGHLALARRPLAAWGAFLAAVVLAAAFGADRWYAWIGTPERHFGAFTWFACFVAFTVGQSLDRAGAKVVAAAGAITAGALGAWAAAETLGWHPIALVGAGSRPVATFGSSAYLGAGSVLLGPVALGFALDRNQSAGARRAAGVAAMFSGVGLVASGARAAWVGAVVAAATIAVLRPAWRAHTKRAVSIALGAVALAVALAFATGVASRVPDLVSDPQGGGRGRVDEWRVAVRVVAQHPLLGTGPEGYRIAFGRAVDARYERVHGRDPLPDRAHDAFLDVAATTGIVGLLAYAVLLFTVGGFVWRALRRAPPWVAGVAGALLAYAVQAVFLFPLAELEPIAWLFAGIAVTEMVQPGEVVQAWVPRPVPVLATAVAVALAGAGVLDVVADHDAKAELAAIAADRFVADPAGAARLRPDQLRYRLAAARVYEARGSLAGLDAALGQIGDALGVSPGDPVARAEQAALLLERAQGTHATRDVERALAALDHLRKTDPVNAEVWLRLGVARALAGDDRGAIDAWQRAESLAPRSAAASTDLALLYLRLHRNADAEAAARRALARDPHNGTARRALQQARG